MEGLLSTGPTPSSFLGIFPSSFSFSLTINLFLKVRILMILKDYVAGAVLQTPLALIH